MSVDFVQAQTASSTSCQLTKLTYDPGALPPHLSCLSESIDNGMTSSEIHLDICRRSLVADVAFCSLSRFCSHGQTDNLFLALLSAFCPSTSIIVRRICGPKQLPSPTTDQRSSRTNPFSRARDRVRGAETRPCTGWQGYIVHRLARLILPAPQGVNKSVLFLAMRNLVHKPCHEGCAWK